MKSDSGDPEDPAAVSPGLEPFVRERGLFDSAGDSTPASRPVASVPPAPPAAAERRPPPNGHPPRDDAPPAIFPGLVQKMLPLLLPAPPRSAERLLLPAPKRKEPLDSLQDLVPAIARRTGHDALAVENVVRAFLGAAAAAFTEADSVDLRPLGSFRVVTRRARTVTHPRTGALVLVPAARSVAFRPGKRLRERVAVPDEIARLLAHGETSAAPAAPPREPSLPVSPASRARLGRLVGIASGKGGTGKTFLAANLAVALSLAGLKVAAVDADLGLANLHLLLGMSPGTTLLSAVLEGAALDSAAETGPGGVSLFSGGSGAAALADLKPSALDRLVAQVRALGRDRDVVMVDSAAGISPRTLRLLAESDLCLVATTPEVTAMTDAYAVLKTMARAAGRAPSLALVVNQARTEAEGLKAHEKLSGVSKKFLGRRIELWGIVPEDPEAIRSIARREPLTLDLSRRGPAVDALRAVARRLEDWVRA